MAERWRDIGGPVGLFPTGERNAITDVPGVRVGHSQAASGEATGVTVVVPPELPTRAGVDTTNGVGELTARWVRFARARQPDVQDDLVWEPECGQARREVLPGWADLVYCELGTRGQQPVHSRW